jgi:hypothetical protein
MFKPKIVDLFALVVVIMYFITGGYVIFSPGLAYIPKSIRVIFGIFLFLYGAYRLTRIIYKERDRD